MNFKLMISVILSCHLAIFATPKDMVDGKPVELKEKRLGKVYMQDGKKLKLSSMYRILQKHESSKKDAGYAASLYGPALIMSAVGGGFIGYPVGQAMVGGEFKTEMFFAGIGMAAVGIIMSQISAKKLEKAVNSYNYEISEESGWRLDFGLDQRSARMVLLYSF